MSVRAIIVQYIGDTLFLPSLERKVNHIIVHNDDGGEEWEPTDFIVNCKDCTRYSLDDYGNTWCAYVASAVQPNDFCVWGERRYDD